MDEQEGRRRLGAAIKADRLRLYGTVESARVGNGVKVSRGTWDKAERGVPITEYKLADIERALGWDAGRGSGYLQETPESGDMQAEVERSNLSPSTKEWILELLGDETPDPPDRREVRGA